MLTILCVGYKLRFKARAERPFSVASYCAWWAPCSIFYSARRAWPSLESIVCRMFGRKLTLFGSTGVQLISLVVNPQAVVTRWLQPLSPIIWTCNSEKRSLMSWHQNRWLLVCTFSRSRQSFAICSIWHCAGCCALQEAKHKHHGR